MGIGTLKDKDVTVNERLSGECERMDLSTIEKFIRKQKVSFICSVDSNGCSNVKAMLKSRTMNILNEFF